ncbi:MAG: choice-of-anchor Q domain-containing protein [Polyangiales bacterium]
MHLRPWLPLLFLLVLGCAGCDLGTKLACNVDSDCFDELTCVSGACYKCAADKTGCACADGSCLHGMVCSADGVCMDCSVTNLCLEGLACDAGRCVACSSDFAGCPCEAGRCGEGLGCSNSNRCEPLACSDGNRNGDESDVDCGGSCSPCAESLSCLTATDCESLACDDGACLAIGFCLVPTGEFPAIQAAVDEPRCVTIKLGEGTFDEQVSIDRALDLVGVPSAAGLGGGTTLSSTKPGPIIWIGEGAGTVYLRHVAIRDGAALRGAGVFSRRDLVVEDSLFIGNHASVNAVSEYEETHPCGGAIFVQDASLTVTDSKFIGNVAEETRFVEQSVGVAAYGGAICVFGNGELTVDSSEFRRNMATITADIPAGSPVGATGSISWAFGGAIYRSHEDLIVVRDSIFSENETAAFVVARAGEARAASSMGGAIYLLDLSSSFDPSKSTVIEGSVFVGNVANAEASGVGAHGSFAFAGAVGLKAAIVRDTTFEHNWAHARPPIRSYASGGAARLRSGRLEATRFWRNRVDGTYADGAAIKLGKDGSIINSVFWDNYGSGPGSSAIDMPGGWVINSTLLNNGPAPQISGNAEMKHSVFAGGLCETESITSAGYNVLEQSDCFASLATETDRLVTAPLIENAYGSSAGQQASSVDNYAQIYLEPGFPLRGSPVIDGGDPAGCHDEAGNSIAVDNRGVARERPCDIGAFALEPEQLTRVSRSTLLLRRATLRSPDLYAPGDVDCTTPVTDVVMEFIKEAITGDESRPPDQACDGLIDSPLVLSVERANDMAVAFLSPTGCVATHVACEDPLQAVSVASLSGGFSFYRILTEEPCIIGEDAAVVPPGEHGCIEAKISRLSFHVGIPFNFLDAELVGQFNVGPERLTRGVLRGYVSAGSAQDIVIPYWLRPALGGADRLLHLLCPADLESTPYLPLEFEVEFEAVSLYGQGLPPIRPVGCE